VKLVNRPPAGSLRHSVELHDVPSETLDAYGQPTGVGTGTLIGTFRANIQPLSGHAILTAKSSGYEVTHKVFMRWLGSAPPGGKILPSMYLIDVRDGTRFDIVFAGDMGGQEKMWELTCQSKVVT